MKKLLPLFVITIMVLASACYKAGSGYGPNNGKHALIGKWRVTANLIGIGGPGTWTNVPFKADYDYAQFKDNLTIGGTAFPDYLTYVFKDSVTVTMTKADRSSYENYRYTIKGDTLVMSPAGPLYCIEGCAVKFVYVGQ